MTTTEPRGHDDAVGAAAREREQAGQVRLVDVRKSYGNNEIVKGVDLSIQRGEFFSILGPSGSGKTTTLMMIAGFAFPTSGSIFIDGKSMEHEPPQRRGLGVVFQNYALFPHLTVQGNVAFPLEARGVPKATIREKVAAIIRLVGLAGYEDRVPSKLSGGQQQRVALARALVFEPHVLLMDEPLGALDKKLRNDMRAEIRRIHKHLGVTVIYVTHDQDEALTMSDRVAIMNDGLIEQIAPPMTIYNEPATRFVAGFLGDSSFLPGVVVSADGARARCTVLGRTVQGLAAQPVAAGNKIVAAIRPERVAIRAQHPEASADMNVATGTVIETVYAGDAISYTVDLGAGTLESKQPYGGEANTLKTGEAVTVQWRPSDTRIFPA